MTYKDPETPSMTPYNLIKEIGDLRQTLQTGDLETLSDPSISAVSDWLERETRDQTRSPIFSESIRLLTILKDQTEEKRRSLFGLLDRVNQSETLTLSDLETGDRVRLSESGVFWSVIHMTHDQTFDNFVQLRSVNGKTRTINVSESDSRIWTDPLLTLDNLDQVSSLVSSLERLIETLSHKVRDLETGDLIEDLESPKLWIVYDLDLYDSDQTLSLIGLSGYHENDYQKMTLIAVLAKLESGSWIWKERPETETQERIDRDLETLRSMTPDQVFSDPEETEDLESETLEDSDQIVTLKIGDCVSNKFRLFVWRVTEIDPESETVTLVRDFGERETLSESFGSLLYSFSICLLIVQRGSQMISRDLINTPDLVLKIGDRLSNDPEIGQTPRPKTWRDPESGDLRDRLSGMVSEIDSDISDYDRTLRRVRDSKETISLLERIQIGDLETGDRERLKTQESKTETRSPDLMLREETADLVMLLEDHSDLQSDCRDLSQSVRVFALEIERRELDPEDPEIETLSLYSETWTDTLIKISQSLYNLLTPRDPEDQESEIEILSSVSLDLLFLIRLTEDPETDRPEIAKTIRELETVSGKIKIGSDSDPEIWKDLYTIRELIGSLRLTVKTLESMTMERLTPSLTDRQALSRFADLVWTISESLRSLTSDDQSPSDLSVRDLDLLLAYDSLRDNLTGLYADLSIIYDLGDYDSVQDSESHGLSHSLLTLTRNLETLESDSDYLDSEVSEIWSSDSRSPDFTGRLERLTVILETADHFTLFSSQTHDQIRDLIEDLEIGDLLTWSQSVRPYSLRVSIPDSETLSQIRQRLRIILGLINAIEDPEDPEDLERLEDLIDLVFSLICTVKRLEDLERLKTDPEIEIVSLTPETVSETLEDLREDLKIGDPQKMRIETISDRLFAIGQDLLTLIGLLQSDPETLDSLTGDLDSISESIRSYSLMVNVINASGHDMTLINRERLSRRVRRLINQLTPNMILSPYVFVNLSESLTRLSDLLKIDPEKVRQILIRLDPQETEDLETVSDRLRDLIDQSIGQTGESV